METGIDNVFSLEEQYKLYLERMRMDERLMPVVQRIETKRAFMGACSQMLLLMENEYSEIEDEDKALEVFDGMKEEAKVFWENEIKNTIRNGN